MSEPVTDADLGAIFRKVLRSGYVVMENPYGQAERTHLMIDALLVVGRDVAVEDIETISRFFDEEEEEEMPPPETPPPAGAQREQFNTLTEPWDYKTFYDQNGRHPDRLFYICPHCWAEVEQEPANFHYWCNHCGKNATEPVQA